MVSYDGDLEEGTWEGIRRKGRADTFNRDGKGDLEEEEVMVMVVTVMVMVVAAMVAVMV